MHTERLRPYIGDEAMQRLDDFDLETETGRAELVDRFLYLDRATPDNGLPALRTVIITHFLTDNPPATWRTAERLRAAGQDPAQVLRNLTIVLAYSMQASLEDNSPFDVDNYVEMLEALPLPSRGDIAQALLTSLRADAAIDEEHLVEDIARSLGSQRLPIGDLRGRGLPDLAHLGASIVL